jgi:hypothetical protein
MASQPLATSVGPRIFAQSQVLHRLPVLFSRSQQQCVCRCHSSRLFSSSTKLYRQQPSYKDSFGTRLRKALGETKIKWYPIPVGLGIGFLGLVQFYKVNERERLRREVEWEDEGYVATTSSGRESGEGGPGERPKRRERIRPSGPWFVFSFRTRVKAADNSQASSSYVHPAFKGYIKTMGQVQRTRDSILFTSSWFQVIFFHFRRKVRLSSRL